MKRFLKILIAFFLPLILVIIGLEYGMRHIPNSYSFKNSQLNNSINTIHIWTFGSSHGLFGISPNHFSKRAFNSAHTSQTILFDKFIFSKYIEQADSLEWIILPISYFSLPETMENNGEWWRIKNYCLYYNCPYYKGNLIYHCEILGNPTPIYQQFIRIWMYLIQGKNDINCDFSGWGIKHSKAKKLTNWVDNGPERAKSHTFNFSSTQEIIHQNIEDLEYIIVKCKEKNVSVLLVTTPVYKTYYEYIDSLQYAFMVKTCNDLAHTYNHVQYMNFFNDSTFIEDDFYDADHLDSIGAIKLTKILDRHLFP